MTNYDVVKKLLGDISPVGETNTDNDRYDNLKETIELVDSLLENIYEVSFFENRVEYSMKRSGELASKFLKGLRYE